MQVASAGLHGEVLLRPDRIGHRRAFERRADVEPPQFLERLVVVGDDPSILQRTEEHAARRVGRPRADLDVGDYLAEHLVRDRVERGDRTVIEIAVVRTLLALLLVDATLRRQERYRRAGLREAAFDAGAVGDVLRRVVRRRLMRDAAVPGWTAALQAVAAQRARRRIVDLDVELRIVVERFARL